MRPIVSRAIGAIYDCAADPALWPETLQRIADCFGDVGALLLYRRDAGPFVTVVSPSLRACAEAYARHWWRHDIRATRSLDYAYAARAGAITDRHFITDEEIATHPIYTEFLAPFGLRWGAGLQVSPSAGAEVALNVQRAASKPPFSDAELDLLAEIGPHVERSLRLGLRLVEAEVATVGLGEAIGRLGVAAFLVEADGMLRFANAMARALLGRALVLRAGRLTCRASEAEARLSALLRADPRDAETRHPPLVVVRGEERLVLHVVPLGAAETLSGLAGQGCSVVLAVDLAAGHPLDPSLIRDAYGLTLGEARVASLVGTGLSPRDAAARLSVSEETVRGVLKRVFAKLDVTRQGELVDLFTGLRLAG